MPRSVTPASCSRAAARPWARLRWWAARWPARALLAAGRVDAGGVAEVGRAPRLVVGRPDPDPVAEPLVDDHRVVGEGLGGVAVEPAAAVLEGLRQVPVVERGGRRDAARQGRVDQPVVVVQAAGLDPAGARGHDPRPGDREAVPAGAQARDQVEVLLVAVVGVAGDRAVLAVAGGARDFAANVSQIDGAAAVLGGRPLDLVRRGGGAVRKGGSVREVQAHGHHRSASASRSGSAPAMTGIKDVAREVEMSTATVSRALRGLPGVSEETRDRVRETARRLGYVPSPSAAGLASGQTRTVAVIVPFVTQWFFAAVVQGAEEELRSAATTCCSTTWPATPRPGTGCSGPACSPSAWTRSSCSASSPASRSSPASSRSASR